MVCYDDPQTCPKSYLYSPEYRKFLANALNSAIIGKFKLKYNALVFKDCLAVTNNDVPTSPDTFLQRARELREVALQVSTGKIHNIVKNRFK